MSSSAEEGEQGREGFALFFIFRDSLAEEGSIKKGWEVWRKCFIIKETKIKRELVLPGSRGEQPMLS